MGFEGPIVAVLALYWLLRSVGQWFFSNYDETCTCRHIPPVVFFSCYSKSLDLNVFLQCSNCEWCCCQLCFPHLLPSSKTLSTPCLSQCLTFRSIRGCLWRPPFNPGHKAPPSPHPLTPFPLAQSPSFLPLRAHRFLFFCVCASR